MKFPPYLMRGSPGPRGEPRAELQLAWACLLVAGGGVLLALQVDGRGRLAGTGYTVLGIGAVVALFASALQASGSRALPRDTISIFSALCGFCGLAFVVAGVLAPGGPWMFFEVLTLLWLLARRRTKVQSAGPDLALGSILALSLMLVFRLWISYQGSEHRWEVMTIPVPVLAWIPLALLDPVKTVSLGSFDPAELGFPPSGLDFPLSMALWAAGFAACVVGLWWRTRAAYEHENDRIHATIQTLPPELALLVEKLLPEEHWQALGLHGLSERMRCKRIEALVKERIDRRRDVEATLQRLPLLAQRASAGFAGDIYTALLPLGEGAPSGLSGSGSSPPRTPGSS